MRYARIRPDRLRRYHAVYRHKWFPVHDRHPRDGDAPREGYVWVDTQAKIQAMELEDLEIVERPEERRGPDRLNEEELEVVAVPNAAGGVIVKVLHRPTRRFATAAGERRDLAELEAKKALTRIVGRVRRRKARGMSER